MRLFFIFAFLGLWLTGFSQVTFYNEGFEASTISLTSSSNSSTSWGIDTTFVHGGVKSNRCSILVGDTVYLTSDSFSTMGKPFVQLEFAQICKIELFDSAFVEVSIDGGTTWQRLTAQQYTGNSLYFGFFNGSFNSACYTSWLPAIDTAMPNNSWWRNETFNITSIAANQNNVKIRFVLIEGGTMGNLGNYGWVIDDIKVKGALSEINPPFISLVAPIIQDTAYGYGPFLIKANITDNSGIDTAKLIWSKNGGVNDTLGMVYSGNLYHAFIQSSNFSNGDTICYHIYAMDGSAMHNTSVEPYSGCIQSVIIINPIPPNCSTPIDSFPWLETFASFTDGSHVCGATCPTANGWVNDTTDNTDWAADPGDWAMSWDPPPYFYDHTVGGFGGKFMYVENTSCQNKTALLTSPCLDLSATQAPHLEFWYHMDGADCGLLTVQIYYGGQWIDIFTKLGNQGYYWNQASINLIPYKFITKLRFKAVTGTGYQRYVAIDDIKIYEYPMHDAGVVGITSPANGGAAGVQPIKITLKNYGGANLTSAVINWKVNGVLQTPFNWTGSMLPFTQANNIQIGLYNFSSGGAFIEAWTSLPNNQTDADTTNDYASVNMVLCSGSLSGIYTIGGTSADYASIGAAATALNTCGVSGPVVFNINTGTYIESVSINTIPGVSATNRVTFQSTSGLNTDVVWKNSGSYVLKLDSAVFVTIKNLHIKATNASYAPIQIQGGCWYDSIVGNIIEGGASPSSYSDDVIYMSDDYNRFNIIKGNKIKNGRYGIYLDSPWNTFLTPYGNEVIDNEISNFYTGGVYAEIQDSIQIIGNTISSNSGGGGYQYGIYLYYVAKAYQISNNIITLNPTNYAKGLYLYRCNYYTAPYTNGKIINNFVSITSGSGANKGMDFKYFRRADIAFNSVSITGGSSSSIAMSYGTGASSSLMLAFMNNNLYNNVGGLAAYYGNPVAVDSCDYNNYYSSGTYLAKWGYTNCATITALQTASSRNAHSISINPAYISNTDLHISNPLMNATGIPYLGITTDIDGETRNATTPDIGADEITPIANDAGFTSIVSPTTACSGSSTNIIASLKNFGADTLTSVKLNWSVNGVVQTQVTYNTALAPGNNINVVIGTYSFSYGTSYNIKAWTSLPNNATDGKHSNDTTNLTAFSTSLPGGSYSIGGTSPDFTTINNAVNYMNNYGICGPVTFNIASGTYNGQILIPQISGASYTNSITFQSTTQDSSDVIISYAPTNTSNNYVLKMSNADFIHLKHLTIKNTTTNAYYGTAVVINNGAHYNSIENCRIEASGTTNTNSRGLSSPAGTINTYNSIINTVIKNGYYGVYLNGLSAHSYNWTFTNNSFDNYGTYGLYIRNTDSVIVEGNDFNSKIKTSGNAYGIYMYYSFGAKRITRNNIVLNSNSTSYGMYMYQYKGAYGHNGLIANNMIVTNNNVGTAYGMYLGGTYYFDIYNNSINLRSPSVYNRGIYVSGNNLNFENNLVNVKKGYPFYTTSANYVLACDYNNFYAEDGVYVAYWAGPRTTISALQSASSKNAHTISSQTYFAASNDLHIITGGVGDAGHVLSLVPEDIDQEIRSLTTPDIGADEFSPPTQEMAMLSISSPQSGCGLTMVPVTVKVKNTGTDTINSSYALRYSINQGVSYITETVTTSINPGDTLEYTFNTQANLTSATNTTFNIWAVCGLANDPFASNDTVKVIIFNGLLPPAPVITGATVAYGNTASLSASSSLPISWFASDTSSLVLGIGTNYTTPILFDTTTFYASAMSTNGCASLRSSTTVNVTGIPAVDVGISAIYTNEGCGLDSTESISIDIYNWGTASVTSGLTAKFRIDNGSWIVPEAVNSTIASNDTITFTFSTPANLYAYLHSTKFNITAVVNKSGDPFSANDTLIETDILSKLTPNDPVVTSPISVAYASKATVGAAPSNDTVYWYNSLNSLSYFASGDSVTTGYLYANDTIYCQAGGVKSPGIIFTEFSVGVPDYFEIQNTSNHAIDATGWKVAVSYNNTQVNSFSSTTWDIGMMQAGEVKYRDDISTGNHYFGANINWAENYNGWAMIIDNNGNVVDYVTWGWSSASINSQSMNINGNYVSGSSVWNGPGISNPSSTQKIIYRTKYDHKDSSEWHIDSIGNLGIENPELLFYGSSNGASVCSSDRIPVIINVGAPPANDVGMDSILYPNNQVAAGVSQPISVQIKNYGTDTLFSANITYEVNGIVKSTYAWSGTLLPNQVSNAIQIATDIFSPGVVNLRVWASLPNNVVSGVNSNDTISNSFTACMSGIYTIGDSTADFLSINDAISALDTAGVCGQVIFEIKTGIYTEKLNLTQANGMSASNNVTFRSMTGNSNDVTIKYAALNYADNGVVVLDGGSYYSFKNIHFQALDFTYGTVFIMKNGSNNNTIDSCDIETNTGITTYLQGILGTSNLDSIIITNNTFINGYYGVHLTGVSQTNLSVGVVISNNTFTGQYYYGMNLRYLNSLIIKNNIISNIATSNNNYYGMYFYKLGDIVDVSSNKINLSYSGNGINLYYCYGTTQGSSRIFNNAIFINSGTNSGYGIRSYYSYYQEIYYNTINVISGSASSYSLFVNAGTDNKIKNNTLTNFGAGYAYYVGSSANVSASDYNNIYTGSTTKYAYWQGARANLAALKSASGKDVHSKSVDPGFFTNYDYKINNAAMNNAAVSISGITDDIDGNTRNTTPDIGAYEYTYIALDAGIISIDAPVMPMMAGNNAIHVTLKNFGQTTLTSVNINYSVNGSTPGVFAWSGSLASGATADSINIGSPAFIGGMNTIKVWSSSPNSSNDLINYNDTINYSINACFSLLHGNYVIGSSSSADYSSFAAAVNDLNGCGIDSAVVFNVESGTYNEQIEINAIMGATANHNVTFKSLVGDSSLVVLSYGSSTLNDNYTLRLNGASYLTFQDMTIKATGANFAHAIEIHNGSSHNKFINNVIESSLTATGTNSAGLYSNGGVDLFNEFIGNRFQNGASNAIYLAIGYSSKEHGTKFIGNLFYNYREKGLQVSYQDSVEIKNNIFVSYNGMPAGGTSAELLSCYNGSIFTGNKITAKPLAAHIGLDISSASGTSAHRTLIANNFISITTGTQSANGIKAYGTDYTDIIFNSVNITSGTAYTKCLYTGFNTSLKLVNNILYNTAGGPAVLEGMWSGFALRDYNCQYPSQYNQGTHSINANPMFVSNTDLHITNSALKGAGTPYGGITHDIDGDSRNATAPDIGADEFLVLTTDVMTELIVSPVSGQGTVGANTVVKMRFKNIGSTTVTSMTVGYIYGNGNPVTATFTGNLQTNDTITYTFATPLSLLIGENNLCVYVSKTGDVNLNNDTLCKTLTGVPLLTPDYFTNFDTVPFYWIGEGQLHQWERGVPNNTSINTAHSSPNVWMTKLNSNYASNIEEYLYTPFFDFSNIQNATMKFWSFYVLDYADYGNIEYSINGGIWSTLGYMTDPKGTNWYNGSSGGTHYWTGTNSTWQLVTYDLSSFNNQSGNIRFRFHIKTNSTGSANGWAIDDFSIELPVISYDAGVTQIIMPADSVSIGINDSVRIRVKNFGSMPLYTIPVNYKIGSAAVVSNSIVLSTSGPGLLPDSTIDFTFPTTYAVPQNDYYICAYTQYPGDSHSQNDSLCKHIKIKYLKYDVLVKRIVRPTSVYNNYSDPDSVSILIVNNGNNSISSIPVEYFIDGNSISQETWTGSSLLHGDSVHFTFATKFIPPKLLNFSVCAQTNLSSDLDTTNDVSCEYIITTDIASSINKGFSLMQNNPNPASGITKIKFIIPYAGTIHFELVSLIGQKLISYDSQRNSGAQYIEIDAHTLTPGVYFYSVEFKGQKLIKKMIVN